MWTERCRDSVTGKGKTPRDWRSSLYYHYYEYPAVHSVRRHEGVFTGRWKLIRYYGRDVPDGKEWELFDLVTDPAELHNVIADPAYREVAIELRTELARLQAEVGDRPHAPADAVLAELLGAPA